MTAIVSTARKDFDLVAKNESLLNNVKERTLDKKFKIRKEALTGLALIYKKHLSDPLSVPDATKSAVTWIKDKILHGDYFFQTKTDSESKSIAESLFMGSVYRILLLWTKKSVYRDQKLSLNLHIKTENDIAYYKFTKRSESEIKCPYMSPTHIETLF